MIVPPGLKLLADLVADHVMDRDGAPLLIPCLHEELENDIQLLKSGAQRCGGTLFFLNAPDDDWEHPPGPISTDRALLVEGLVASSTDALPGSVIVEEVEGEVRARLEGASDAVEPSLLPILRAAAIVSSSAYDEYNMVIVAAEIGPTDPRRRLLLWSLMTLDPADLSLAGAQTTLVPIIGSWLEPEHDYLRRPALRYVVRADRVIRRSRQMQEHSVKTIAEPDGRPLLLFLGAGASASSGIRLGNAYRDIALEALVGHRDDRQAAAEAFFDLLHERQHFLPGESASRAEFVAGLTLERVLLETFLDLGTRPRSDAPVIQELIKDCDAALQYERPGRKALRELAAGLKGRLIIATVNFDQLVEEELGVDHAVYFLPEHFVERRDDLLAYVSGDATKPVPILKLHGSIEDPDSLIATIDSTSAGLHDDVKGALNAVLNAVAGPVRWVWVGCSMRDRDMNLWLGGLSANALDEWWVDPLPGQSLDDFFDSHRAPKWSTQRRTLTDRLIVDSADAFLGALANEVTTGGVSD